MEMKVKLAGKKKKSVKKTERPSWKEVIKKTYEKDPPEKDTPEKAEAAALREQAVDVENTVLHAGTETVSGRDTGADFAKQEISPEKLREAVLWAEILGEPVSRKRQEDRRRRLRGCDRREG